MTFLILLELILLVILVLSAINFFNIVFKGFAPFFAANSEVIKLVIDNIKPVKGQIVYELGAGTANFLKGVEAQYPETKLIGVEYSFFPYLLAKAKLKTLKSKIDLRRQNLYKTDLHDASFIYCYLIPTMMPRLSEKIQKECQPGTTVISYIFSIPNLSIRKTIETKGGNIYFYQV
ncbi:MAG: class I SAM-dependent methyltransferase [Candidatus Falkowbacteria bacterium]